MSSEKHIVVKLEHPVRLSDYVTNKFIIIPTRKGMKKAIDKGWVLINSRRGYTGDILYGGEILELNLEHKNIPEIDLQLQVHYEDDHLAVIEKPAGITSSGNKRYTVQNALHKNLNPSFQKDALPPQLIHRLDHPTSGVMLVGKSHSSIVALGRAFADQKIKKTYHAISIGTIPSEGLIEKPIEGKSSITEFKVLDNQDSDRFEKLNLVELHPKTGRRHQIRNHLHSIGHPILGDKVYYLEGKILMGKGLYLHASAIQFEHPVSEEEIRINSVLPKKFKKIFGNYLK